MKLIQLIVDEEEEGLYIFSDETTEENIRNYYKLYRESKFEDFEEFITSINEECKRVFIDETICI